jgi:nucleoside-diphosphate-sugar epimerase
VDGLRGRGFAVTLLHSGAHEVAGQQNLEHLHGDAFSQESLDTLIEGRTFDVVVAMYGRTRLLADCVAGHCGQFIAIGGAPVYNGYFVTRPACGLAAQPVREGAQLVGAEATSAPYPVHTIRKTEDAVLDHHARGSFSATVLRYPTLYGPRVAHNWEWLIIRRILDNREVIYLPDGGLSIHSRMAWANASEAVLRAVDRPGTAAGNAYNVADLDQFALRDWVRLIAGLMGAELDIRSVPGEIPSPGWAMFAFGYPALSHHFLLDSTKIRRELGYEDVLDPAQALGETIAWTEKHPEIVDATMNLFFDYAREDAFTRAYEQAMALLAPAGGEFADVPSPPR